jgi:hypothetical protein
MRGTYEAFILVKVKDGREFVCALNRQAPAKSTSEKTSVKDQEEYLQTMVIWN